jgi:anti-sigma28 factor (negative regulator of flagellin synthesis)
MLSEPHSDQPPDRSGRAESDAPEQQGRRPADPPTASAQRRKKRIRRLKELVQDADYDVSADEVAARIIRDALFGAPDSDGPS